eukprot:scaffold43252_cov28-Tisochrysis_lutea.AAC.1
MDNRPSRETTGSAPSPLPWPAPCPRARPTPTTSSSKSDGGGWSPPHAPMSIEPIASFTTRRMAGCHVLVEGLREIHVEKPQPAELDALVTCGDNSMTRLGKRERRDGLKRLGRRDEIETLGLCNHAQLRGRRPRRQQRDRAGACKCLGARGGDAVRWHRALNQPLDLRVGESVDVSSGHVAHVKLHEDIGLRLVAGAVRLSQPLCKLLHVLVQKHRREPRHHH